MTFCKANQGFIDIYRHLMKNIKKRKQMKKIENKKGKKEFRRKSTNQNP